MPNLIFRCLAGTALRCEGHDRLIPREFGVAQLCLCFSQTGLGTAHSLLRLLSQLAFLGQGKFGNRNAVDGWADIAVTTSLPLLE